MSPWWKAIDPFGSSTYTGSMALHLRIVEDVLGHSFEDVDELAQAELMAARQIGHRSGARLEPSNGIHAVTDAVSLIGQ